jgi:cytochrome c556
MIRFQSPQLLWLSMLILAVGLTAVVWLYRPQLRPVPAPWWWLLLGLRALALGVLGLCILRPVVLRSLEDEQRGVAVVLVDQSKSMTVVDPLPASSSTRAQMLVQLADALGTLPAGARPRDIEDLRQGVLSLRHLADEVSRAFSELDYARVSGRGIESAEQHLGQSRQAFAAQADELAEQVSSLQSVETAQRAAMRSQLTALVAEPAASADAWSRAVAVRIAGVLEQLEKIQSRSDQQLYATSPQVRAACDELAGLSRAELVRRALNGPEGLIARLKRQGPVLVFGFSGPGEGLRPIDLPIDQLDADGAGTDLNGAIRDLRQRLGMRPLSALIVFSDGRQVDQEQPAGLPPITPDSVTYGVLVGSAVNRDLSIQRVALPQSAFVGETILVRVDVRATGERGSTPGEITAEVSVSDGQQRVARHVRFEQQLAHVELPLRLDQAGPTELSIAVSPLDGEITAANNTVRRDVKVIAEPVRVGLIGGVATWDYQFLRRALMGAIGFDTTEQLVFASVRPLRMSADHLLRQDVVILCDVPTEALDAAQWDALSRLIRDRGGSAILILCDTKVIDGYAWHPLAAAMLPWRGDARPAWRVWPGEQPVFRIVPGDFEPGQMLRLSDDPQLNQFRWNNLPPVFSLLAMPQPLKAGVRALLVEDQTGSAVLTESRLGAGRVLVLGLNELWRWRVALPDRAKDRFWLQLIRYAAPEPYAVRDGELALDAQRLRVEPGQPLHVRARSAQFEGPAPLLEIYRDNVLHRAQLLSPVLGDRWETTISDLPAGEYELRMTADDGELSVSLPVQVASSDEQEMRDVSADPSSLRRLLGQRAEVLALSDIAALPQRLQVARQAEQRRYDELSLWDSPYLFLFVLGCLGAEWSIRRKVGLA